MTESGQQTANNSDNNAATLRAAGKEHKNALQPDNYTNAARKLGPRKLSPIVA